MDPLSGVLSLLKPRNTMCGGFDVGGEWSFQFPQHEGIKCYAVVSGQCWLSVEGVPDAVHLKTGDCFLLPLGRPFRLASDLALPPVDFRSMHSTPLNGGIASWNGGGDVSGVGGYFGLAAITPVSCWGCSRRSCISRRNRTRRRCVGPSSG